MGDRSEPSKEHCLREVERVMLFIADADRKAKSVAAELASAGAEPLYVDALNSAAEALRSEHNRLLRTTHFTVPADPLPDRSEVEDEQEDPSQQRMAL